MIEIIIGGERWGSKKRKGRIKEKRANKVIANGIDRRSWRPERVVSIEISNNNSVSTQLVEKMCELIGGDRTIRVVQVKEIKTGHRGGGEGDSLDFQSTTRERGQRKMSKRNIRAD